MNKFITYVVQDWEVNKGTSFKSRLVLVLLRLTQLIGRWSFPFFLFRFVYQLVVEWILGIELPWDTQIGQNLQLQHGLALVVNHETIIGTNCILRHSTTLGNKKLQDGSYSASPKIGNNVDIGSNVVILGAVTVGDNAIIGAGSVVVKDVPEGAVVAGNPARVIRTAKTTSFSICDQEVNTLELASASNKSKIDNL